MHLGSDCSNQRIQIFNIERQSTLKTLVTLFWKKLLDAYDNIICRDLPAWPPKAIGEIGRESLAPAGGQWWAGQGSLSPGRQLNSTLIYFSQSRGSGHLRSICNVNSMVATMCCGYESGSGLFGSPGSESGKYRIQIHCNFRGT